MERLEKAFLAVKVRPSAEITRLLVDSVNDFTKGRPAEDDRTVVVVKRTADSAPRPSDRAPRATDGTPKA